jgi:hypothetical protein
MFGHMKARPARQCEVGAFAIAPSYELDSYCLRMRAQYGLDRDVVT